MTTSERSVLHVLPHPGGGGETYVDALGTMEGYRFARVFLAPSPRGSGVLPSLARTVPSANVAGRDHDLVHLHGEMASALCLPVLVARPSVVTLHGLNLVLRLGGIRRRAAVANLRLLLRAADQTICVSTAEHDNLVDAVGEEAASQAVVIYNGVELPSLPDEAQRLSMRAELGIAPERFVGIWIGALEDHKDPLTPVLAAAKVTAWGVPLELLVVGDGALKPQVEAERGDAIRLLGYRHDATRLLAAADFFVLSSLREALGYSLLEAMAMGLPAVVSSTKGPAEAAGEPGIVVRARDVEAFAQAFVWLWENPGERIRRGRSARERIEQHFRAAEMVEKTRDVYERILAGPGSSLA